MRGCERKKVNVEIKGQRGGFDNCCVGTVDVRSGRQLRGHGRQLLSSEEPPAVVRRLLVVAGSSLTSPSEVECLCLSRSSGRSASRSSSALRIRQRLHVVGSTSLALSRRRKCSSTPRLVVGLTAFVVVVELDRRQQENAGD